MKACFFLVAVSFLLYGQLHSQAIADEITFAEEFVFPIKPLNEVAFYDRIEGNQIVLTHDGFSPLLVQVEREGWLQLRFGSYVVWSKKANFVLANRSHELFDSRIKSNPDDAWALSMKGAYWVLKKSPYLARSHFTQSIQKDSKYVAAYTGRAKAWLDSEYYKLAIEDCDEALRLDVLLPNLRSSSNESQAFSAAGMTGGFPPAGLLVVAPPHVAA